MITKEFLKLVAYKTPKIDLDALAGYMNGEFTTFGIESKEQQCAFIAQIAHETGGFRWLEELGNKTYFNKYEPGTSIGKKLGNKQPGDGAKFKGRGLIQLTGRSNYMAFGKWLKSNYGRTFEVEEVASVPFLAFMAAIWYWHKNNLKDTKDFKVLTRKINGGYNGLEDRQKKYNLLLKNYKDEEVVLLSGLGITKDIIEGEIMDTTDSLRMPWWKRLFGG